MRSFCYSLGEFKKFCSFFSTLQIEIGFFGILRPYVINLSVGGIILNTRMGLLNN